MVLEIEVQGARQVREAMPESVQVFIAPPAPATCGAGSRAGAPTTAEAIDERLRTAELELAAQEEFGTSSSTTRSSVRPASWKRIVRERAGAIRSTATRRPR